MTQHLRRGGTVSLTVAVPAEDAVAFRKAAAAEGITVADLLRSFVYEAIGEAAQPGAVAVKRRSGDAVALEPFRRSPTATPATAGA